MIENINDSKTPRSGEFVDVKKFIGVGSVNIVAINPNNATLRKYGWAIPDDADERSYVYTKDKNGNPDNKAKVRFLLQIQDLKDKPVVPFDIWIRPEAFLDKTGQKCKVIDAYGRTAWASKEEYKAHKIPRYTNGPADIDSHYAACHPGESELVTFLMRYLNCTPLTEFNRTTKAWEPTSAPGKLTIDNWKELCVGNVNELKQYVASKPENRLKLIFGVETLDNNHTVQRFMVPSSIKDRGYIGNGASPDTATGEYIQARKAIDAWLKDNNESTVTFTASPIREWVETATDVDDNSSKMFDSEGNYTADDLPEDIPMGPDSFGNDLPFEQ